MDMTHVHECCNMNVVTLRKQVMIVWVGFILLRLFIKGTLSLEQIRTKRLELLRNYFHSCLRGDCLPISTCSFLTHIMGMSITIIATFMRMRMLLHECSVNHAMSMRLSTFTPHSCLSLMNERTCYSYNGHECALIHERET